ncbi:MAG: sulfatase, partial [Actinomycetes bacterium]
VGSLRVPHPAVASAETDPAPPNIVVVLTDDMRTDEMDALRKTNDLLVDQGTTFTHAIAPTSLCCPARAALLTGTYSHTNNVWSNEGPLGGWPVFQPMEADTIATTLDSLGYQTGYFGKYLNGWGSSSTVSPPGWDSFAATANYGKDPYFGYDIAGTLPTEHMGGAEEDYSTDVYGTRAADFIASTPESTPFLTIFAPHAPHSPFTSAPRYQGSWPLEDLVPPANEQDMGDKPSFMQALPLLKRSQLKATLRKQHEALLPVDDAVQQIVSAVGPSRVANTLFIFTSDNSLMNGDHRMTGKAMPHAGATQIPMVMRWDGVIDSGAITSRLLTLQDVTATIAEAAGATFPTEGISWLSGRRDGSVVEGIESTRDHIVRPAYCGWRTSRYLYVRYSSGAGEELYDYSTDPAELRNAIFNTQYAAIADQMRTAAQSVCDPGPPGFSWDVQPTP